MASDDSTESPLDSATSVSTAAAPAGAGGGFVAPPGTPDPTTTMPSHAPGEYAPGGIPPVDDGTSSEAPPDSIDSTSVWEPGADATSEMPPAAPGTPQDGNGGPPDSWEPKASTRAAPGGTGVVTPGAAAAAAGVGLAAGTAAAIGRSAGGNGDGPGPDGTTLDPAVTDLLRRHYLSMVVDLENLAAAQPVTGAVVPEGARLHKKGYTGKVATITALITFLVLAIFGGLGYMMFGSKAEPVSEEDALAEFRAQGGTDDSSEGDAAAPDAAAPDAAAPGAGSTGGSSSGGSTSGGSSSSGGAATQSGAGSGDTGGGAGGGGGGQQAPPATGLVPPQGVYTYNGSGYEELKLGPVPPQRNNFGATQAILKHTGNNCWDLDTIFHSKSRRQNTYCSSGDGGLVITGSIIDKEQFGVSARSVGSCGSGEVLLVAGMQPGQTWDNTCIINTKSPVTNDSITSAGPTTYIGVERLNIGGRAVDAHHVAVRRTVSGAQTGSTASELWFATDTGMLLRFDTTQQTSGVATVTEDSSFVLSSLAPKT